MPRTYTIFAIEAPPRFGDGPRPISDSRAESAARIGARKPAHVLRQSRIGFADALELRHKIPRTPPSPHLN